MSSDSGHAEEQSDRREEKKENIVEEWAIPEENVGSVHHFYRGELDRTNVWRTRLDATTNWAVVTTGVLISVSFSSSYISHSILLAGIPVVALFLLIESRRFRKFDLYRSRIRLVEQNYFSTLFSSEPVREMNNGKACWPRACIVPLFSSGFTRR